MRKITLIACTFISLQSFAQTQKIVLSQGQKINVTQVDSSTISISAMGQEINITGNNNTTTLLEIKSVADNNNVVISTLKQVKSSGEAMGNSQTYDSDKAGDKDSPLATQYASLLNKPTEFIIDNHGKEVKAKKSETTEETSNPMQEMFTSAYSNISNAFMALPAAAKAGYSWVDSSSEDKIKTIKKYTLKDIKGNEALINLDVTITGEKTNEAQGMEMTVTLNTKTTGEITSDITTGLVKKNVMVTEINNTMEMMGNSNPMTGKINTTITYSSVQ
jgi:hypothetical protein